MYFAMAAMGRYYPMAENMEKFFLGTLFGFNVEAIDGKTSFAGLLVGLETGYKLMLGKTFSLEPSMAYIYSKSGGGGLSSFFGNFASVAPLGWKASLRLGFTF
jgi:outer membrane autotransporter protein